ncbi:UDP-N-acetylmuramoyl-tripeptide--D-alanyl-D-alanine ligase [Laceyella sediminis]|jgi:UDP-N-acetylmuramoyl-tripeptide--D-alanyl-D-alanine ligase|uniref:UDP-N-acetylmuramoyl-tripeptide--D-alanyl-D-alanine ligase n=1 Tax=Laceyella sediminis TaxID=573074 RepID=A0ABX5ESQ4_9BACL|nr:UDP-N-acetylmuramoyl-tripeptide--D-alanyl-D-alanine ligase [Laceyella sediminis]PRZ16983.1 UDP-N-acetylmuramoyl-tripeptide--D-alanyl-D-alanine ligase [Laceyella sediminis]
MSMERTCEWISHVTGGKLVGPPTARHLLVRGVSTDTRTLQANQLYVPLVGERFDGHQFLNQAVDKGAAAALWSSHQPVPETPPIPLIVVDDTLSALQRIASSYRDEMQVQVVAVTGSNGKTTTKDLIAAVLSEAYRVHKTKGNLNNHIGVPLTLTSMSEDTQVAVVEMGMNHAGEIEVLSHLAKPDVAVITNIGESHLEFLGSREGIAKAKLEIKKGLNERGPLIYDGDEPLLAGLLADDPHPKVRVGWSDELDESPVDVEMVGVEGFRFRSRRCGTPFVLPLLGRHNVKNALMAVAVGRALGMEETAIARGLAKVQLTGMRLELKQAANGMDIIDDAYNASPTSMRAAIDLLMELAPEKEKWALLGDIREIGSTEEQYHRELGAYAVEKGVSRLYTVGERGRWIAEGARSAASGSACVIHHFSSHEEAAQLLSAEGNAHILLLVKASRAVQLDIVIRKLTEGA